MNHQSNISGKKWDVFLCHNAADKEWVRTLAARLEAETIDGSPSGRKIGAFFDEWDIDDGENIVLKLNSGLAGTRIFCPVLSPEFLESKWTAFEWTHVVAQNPDGRNILPIHLRDLSLDGTRRIALPAPFVALKRMDFRDKTSFERTFQRLLRRVRGLPPLRGLGAESRYSSAGILPIVATDSSDSWEADRIRDLLLGNLLEVLQFPSVVWHAETNRHSPKEVRSEFPLAPGFVMKEGRLWTFADLSHEGCMLRKVIAKGTVEHIASSEWLVDDDRIRWWTSLLNRTIAHHLFRLHLRSDGKGRFFFQPSPDGGSRTWRTGSDPAREVAAKKTNTATGQDFWVHHAARIRFERLGNRFFLLLEPTYLFTSDGRTPLSGQSMGKMVMLWGGRQRNDTIVRNLIFWMKVVSGGKKEIHIQTGAEPIVVSGIPATAEIDRGIEGDAMRIGSLMNIVERDELNNIAQDVVVNGSNEDQETEVADE